MKKPNLVFMYGEDHFTMSTELSRWKAAFLKKHGDMNLEDLDGAKTSIEQIKYSIQAAPFLGEKRLILLKGFMGVKKADEQKELIPLLEKLPETSVLLIVESGNPDKRTALYKALQKEATCKAFELPKGAMLSRWVEKALQKEGAQITSDTADYLASIVGPNLWQLHNEVQKLSLYAKGQSITRTMVDELVSGSIEQSIFTLTDQLAKGQLAAALKSIKKLREQDQESPYLFAMITRQFRLMIEMKSLSEEGLPPQSIAKIMKVHPYVVKTTLSQCCNFSYGQLKDLLDKLLTLDRRLKTGGIHYKSTEQDHFLLEMEKALVESKLS